MNNTVLYTVQYKNISEFCQDELMDNTEGNAITFLAPKNRVTMEPCPALRDTVHKTFQLQSRTRETDCFYFYKRLSGEHLPSRLVLIIHF